MISVNRQTMQGKTYNDVRCLSTDTKPTDVRNGSTCLEMDTGKTYMYDASTGTWVEGQFPIPHTGLGE